MSSLVFLDFLQNHENYLFVQQFPCYYSYWKEYLLKTKTIYTCISVSVYGYRSGHSVIGIYKNITNAINKIDQEIKSECGNYNHNIMKKFQVIGDGIYGIYIDNLLYCMHINQLKD